MASVIIRTAIMIGATLLVLRRWTTPRGSFTILYSVTAIALAGLEGFEAIALVAPFIVGGVVADVIASRDLARPRRDRLVGLAVPLAIWPGFFAIHAALWGIHWPAEIWTGAIVFSVMTGLGLAMVANGLSADPRRALDPSPGDVAA